MGKRIFQEVIAGGLSGLFLVLIYILVRAHFDGAQPGDWLQFAGALLGSGTAVGGALFIERRKRDRDAERGKTTLMDALSAIAHAIDAQGAHLD